MIAVVIVAMGEKNLIIAVCLRSSHCCDNVGSPKLLCKPGNTLRMLVNAIDGFQFLNDARERGEESFNKFLLFLRYDVVNTKLTWDGNTVPFFFTGLILTAGETKVNVFVATVVSTRFCFFVMTFLATTRGKPNVNIIVAALVASIAFFIFRNDRATSSRMLLPFSPLFLSPVLSTGH